MHYASVNQNFQNVNKFNLFLRIFFAGSLFFTGSLFFCAERQIILCIFFCFFSPVSNRFVKNFFVPLILVFIQAEQSVFCIKYFSIHFENYRKICASRRRTDCNKPRALYTKAQITRKGNKNFFFIYKRIVFKS